MSVRTDTQTRSRTDADVDLALCRSAAYVALACGFAPVDAEMHRRVASPEGADALHHALDHLGVEAEPALSREPNIFRVLIELPFSRIRGLPVGA